MSKQKKSGNKNTSLQKIILVTAILNLIKALIEFIRYLIE